MRSFAFEALIEGLPRRELMRLLASKLDGYDFCERYKDRFELEFYGLTGFMELSTHDIQVELYGMFDYDADGNFDAETAMAELGDRLADLAANPENYAHLANDEPLTMQARCDMVVQRLELVRSRFPVDGGSRETLEWVLREVLK